MSMPCKKVLGFGLIFCILTSNIDYLSARNNVGLSEILLSIYQTLNEAERIENELPVKNINRRYIANQLQALVVSGLDTYPSQAGIIIQTAIRAPVNVRKSVFETVRRDFPGFVHLLKPIPEWKAPKYKEKSLLDRKKRKKVRSENQKADGETKFSLAELVLGVSAHDVGAFGRNKESGGNINLELRFTPFEWSIWKMIYEPQPHIGIHLNSDNNTNQIYAGAGWAFDITTNIVLSGTLGLALHDGKTSTTLLNKKELGSHVLFRESLDAGYRLTKTQTISIYLDHISNAGIAENNEGLDTFGLRYAYLL